MRNALTIEQITQWVKNSNVSLSINQRKILIKSLKEKIETYSYWVKKHNEEMKYNQDLLRDTQQLLNHEIRELEKQMAAKKTKTTK